MFLDLTALFCIIVHVKNFLRVLICGLILENVWKHTYEFTLIGQTIFQLYKADLLTKVCLVSIFSLRGICSNIYYDNINKIHLQNRCSNPFDIWKIMYDRL